MPVRISVRDDLIKLDRRLEKLSQRAITRAAVQGVNQTAFAARSEVMSRLPSIFDRPTPTTMRSVLVRKAEPRDDGAVFATVYIRDEAPKGRAPSRYLSAEATGGNRAMKASERSLQGRSLMLPSQQLVPASGITLDQYGNIRGGLMTRMLSRVGGFSEMGYQANATSKTIAVRRKKGALVVKKNGTEYFIARSRRDGQPLGIYKLVARGVVRPMVWFVDRRPRYSARFPFKSMVEEFASARIKEDMLQALLRQLRSD